jgi:sRNA-binding regulator protein Hfq
MGLSVTTAGSIVHREEKRRVNGNLHPTEYQIILHVAQGIMPKPSRIPASRSDEPSAAKTLVPATGGAARSSKIASVISLGPRKLVRPSLPAETRERRLNLRRAPVLTAQEIRGDLALTSLFHDPSHAETYYLRKQAQDQTPMVVVLDDGERIEGTIEWYDRHSIKVRNGVRTLIYKSSIKYLYKALEKPGRNDRRYGA